MKREGRLHGLVRTFKPDPINPKTNFRPHKLIASPPTAGSFSKVSSKPTNHSKPTGKDPTGPVSKIKGTNKLRSGDIVLNHRLLDWRLVDGSERGYIPNDDDDDDWI